MYYITKVVLKLIDTADERNLNQENISYYHNFKNSIPTFAITFNINYFHYMITENK